MKIRTLFGTAGTIAILATPLFTANAQGPGRGRGMPAEAREAIHGLFDSHDKFKREVTKTEDGYVSKTTSKDPAAVKLLQTHVKQMESRLKSGMMVRRWDPAYEEFVRHYDDIDIKITNIENGISITTVGATEDARKVARNHAGIISKFIKKGWSEHDKTHPAVLATKKAPKGAATAGEKEDKVCAECASPNVKMKAEGKACANCAKPVVKEEPKACADCGKPLAKREGNGCPDCAKPTPKADQEKPCCKGTAGKQASQKGEANAANGKPCCRKPA